MKIKRWKGNVKGGFIMGKVIDFNKVKNIRISQNKINRTTEKVDKTIENKYIKAFKSMTDEEIKMVEDLLEN